jgi:hypothetical protein
VVQHATSLGLLPAGVFLVEAAHDVPRAELPAAKARPQLRDEVAARLAAAERREHLVLGRLDPLGDLDLALAREERQAIEPPEVRRRAVARRR